MPGNIKSDWWCNSLKESSLVTWSIPGVQLQDISPPNPSGCVLTRAGIVLNVYHKSEVLFSSGDSVELQWCIFFFLDFLIENSATRWPTTHAASFTERNRETVRCLLHSHSHVASYGKWHVFKIRTISSITGPLCSFYTFILTYEDVWNTTLYNWALLLLSGT